MSGNSDPGFDMRAAQAGAGTAPGPAASAGERGLELTVNGHRSWCYTGGHALQAGRPTVVFLHGVLNAHSVWLTQAHWFAQHGWNVLAPDLPGHLGSAGSPPRSVEEAAGFVLALLDAAGIERAALVGHSFGSLTALEAAAHAPARVSHLALVGTAYPMQVSPALISASLETPQDAIGRVARWSHAKQLPASAPATATALQEASRALMQTVLASNPETNLMYTGFKACNDYRGGEAAMARVACPTLFLLGAQDVMTPLQAAATLQAGARHARTVTLNCGHALMAEDPQGVLQALQDFLAD